MAGDRRHSLPLPCDRLAGGTSKRNHRVKVADHGAVRRIHSSQNGIWVERFNRTLQVEWAYRRVYLTNDARTAALDPWLEDYNTRRCHSAIGGRPPVSRLAPMS